MIKKFSLFAALVILLVVSAQARAQTDAVTTALQVVDRFDAALLTETSPISDNPIIGEYINASARDIEATVKQLRALRWTEAPSRRRYQRVRTLVEAYISGRISAMMRLQGDLPEKERGEIDSSIGKLNSLKGRYLAEIKKSSRFEVKRKRKEKAVPLIDRSRYDDTPGESKGIWDR